MFVQSKTLRHDLRNPIHMASCQALPETVSTIFKGCSIFQERKRFYIVHTFRCNMRCEFCSFHSIKMREKPIANLRSAIDFIFKSLDTNTTTSISITGGEPMINRERISHLVAMLSDYKKQIRWIGIGTNAMKYIDLGFSYCSAIPIRFFISRHHYDAVIQKEVFRTIKLPKTSEWINRIAEGGKNSLALSCNLLRGYIDSSEEVIRYLQWAQTLGVKGVVFRELNALGNEHAAYGNEETLRYLKYYQNAFVNMNDILSKIEKISEFKFIEQSVRPFIYHEIWRWKNKIDVLFRRISEENIVAYNTSMTKIDEYVMWPDGQVNGCWDYQIKKLWPRKENEHA